MKAALYIRVSTDEQAEEGFSLPAQVNQLSDYCKKNNIEIYKTYIDDGFSAKYEDEKKRPHFEQMLKDASNKLFNIIVVHKYDRFARNVELSKRVKRQLKEAGVNVISISEPIEDSPIGFFQEGILELLAEYYIRNLSQESKKGHVERARQGYHNGSVPYGYKIDRESRNMVINDEQADIVRLIFDLYNNKGYGSTKIAIWLNEHGIPSAINSTWAHYTVNRVLKNVKYIGKIMYDGEIYEGKHEPIISDNEFNIAQKNMNDRTWRRSYRGANFEKFTLLGLMKCGSCGRVMRVIVSWRKNRKSSRYYYICNGINHMNKCENSKHHQVVQLEHDVFEIIKQVAENKVPEIQIKQTVDFNSLYFNRKTKIETELNRAKTAYLSGVFTIEEYKEIKLKCENELKELQQYLSQGTQENQRNDVINKINNSWDQFQAEETPSGKRKILQTYVDSIIVYRNNIDIIFY